MYHNEYITDWDIQALVDGELDKKSAGRVLEAIEQSAALQKRYQHHLYQKKLLKIWHKDH